MNERMNEGIKERITNIANKVLAAAAEFVQSSSAQSINQQEGWLPPTKRASAAKIN